MVQCGYDYLYKNIIFIVKLMINVFRLNSTWKVKQGETTIWTTNQHANTDLENLSISMVALHGEPQSIDPALPTPLRRWTAADFLQSPSPDGSRWYKRQVFKGCPDNAWYCVCISFLHITLFGCFWKVSHNVYKHPCVTFEWAAPIRTRPSNWFWAHRTEAGPVIKASQPKNHCQDESQIISVTEIHTMFWSSLFFFNQRLTI